MFRNYIVGENVYKHPYFVELIVLFATHWATVFFLSFEHLCRHYVGMRFLQRTLSFDQQFFFALCTIPVPSHAKSSWFAFKQKKTCLNRNWWNISSNIGTNDSSFSIRCAVKIFRYRKKTACKAKNSFEKKYQFFGKRLERIQWKIRFNNAL